ncbi:hypothetical protein B0T10DRAFT_44489 [Thelonectria olida]|uniref:Secreted protein n=1 Tax=Thelonectria olida TaxID=1576542 RepID=A0A9P8W5H4_9HYPO|nr:hypothetical protein B0T10DRAFT_44489 [Thelonectria olida]
MPGATNWVLYTLFSVFSFVSSSLFNSHHPPLAIYTGLRWARCGNGVIMGLLWQGCFSWVVDIASTFHACERAFPHSATIENHRSVRINHRIIP